jgi:hypothetical protein
VRHLSSVQEIKRAQTRPEMSDIEAFETGDRPVNSFGERRKVEKLF